MAAQPAAAPNGGDHLPPVPEDETVTNMANMNRYKLKPPFFNGDYGTFEEWKYKFTAYMGLQDTTQICYKQRNKPQQNSQRYNYEQRHQQSKMVNDMFASALI